MSSEVCMHIVHDWTGEEGFSIFQDALIGEGGYVPSREVGKEKTLSEAINFCQGYLDVIKFEKQSGYVVTLHFDVNMFSDSNDELNLAQSRGAEKAREFIPEGFTEEETII